MFFSFNNESFTAILVYVDDIVLTGNDIKRINQITSLLDVVFKIKDLGNLKFFLGIEVARSPQGIHLCQRKYTLDILSDSGMLACRPAATPMDCTTHLQSQGDPLPATAASSYRRLIGRLIYLTNTRPDISYVVQQLSQFMNVPTIDHQKAASRVLRYLKGSPGQGLFYPASGSIHIQAFSDSDWAGCRDTRRSITGYSIFLGNSLISWKSKKQSTVSRSSSKAEYRALAATTCEIQWLTYLLLEFRISFNQPANLFCDNNSAIQIASNQVFHERTKHIELDCHIVREKCLSGLLKLLPVRSSMQLADAFTKALQPASFKFMISKLGMMNIYSQLEGGS